MKPRLQTSLGQQLVLTPQLRQAIHLLQLSALELEAEIAEAVESNPLLDWSEPEPLAVNGDGNGPAHDEPPPPGDQDGDHGNADGPGWEGEADAWQQYGGSGQGTPSGDDDEFDNDPGERGAAEASLHDHLLWQLHLTPLSQRDRRIGAALVDAIDDNGYLGETLAAIAQTVSSDSIVDEAEVLAVLRQLQRFDPVGVGARNLAECLQLQLASLPDNVEARELALRITQGQIERLPKLAIEVLARELQCTPDQASTALQLLRTLDPRPGAQIGAMPVDTYVTPDAVIWRQQGTWRVALASNHLPRLTIHRGYEQMLAKGSAGADAGYMRGRLQEARWLLKNIEARGETLLKVVRCLVREQSGFLEFGAQALRPLTLREVAAEVGLHESTISRAISRKYVRTPRGTVALRSFFASGIDTEGGGEASSTAIQAMIRRLIDGENPRKPLSDARLADTLKASGVPVARRTVAKYREAMNIPSSHDRVRLG